MGMDTMQEDRLLDGEVPDYACIALECPGKLRITQGNENVRNIVRDAINKTWKSGIQKEKNEHGVAIFTLNLLSPSSATKLKNTDCCRMVMQIFQDLYVAGWDIVTSSTLSKKRKESSWFFRNTGATKPPPLFLCMMLRKSDILQFFSSPNDHSENAGQNDELEQKLSNAIKNTLVDNWEGMKTENNPQTSTKFEEEGNDRETVQTIEFKFKLPRKPWTSKSEKRINCNKLIKCIFKQLAQLQFTIYVSANVGDEVDSIFFRHKADMTPVEQTSPSFILSLNKDDRIRLTDDPQNVMQTLRETVEAYWLQGLQPADRYSTEFEFKLKGTPWWADVIEGVKARSLLCGIFQRLKCQGWELQATMNISMDVTGKSMFLFTQSGHPEQIELPCICISGHGRDTIRVSNADQRVVNLVKETINEGWGKGISENEGGLLSRMVRWIRRMLKMPELEEIQEFKLKGCPWYGGGPEDSDAARSLMCFLLKKMTDHNWHLVTSADVSSKYNKSKPSKVSSWFFSGGEQDEPDTRSSNQDTAVGGHDSEDTRQATEGQREDQLNDTESRPEDQLNSIENTPEEVEDSEIALAPKENTPEIRK